jgi:hypothetical protein
MPNRLISSFTKWVSSLLLLNAHRPHKISAGDGRLANMAKSKRFRVIIFLSCIMAISSCKKKCTCSATWNSTTVYVPGNTVSYNGNCYEAVNQGSGEVPGPWMQNQNDVWKECSSE